MTNLAHYAVLPIISGPYCRRRLVRFRAPVRQFGMIVALTVAIGGL